MSHDLSLVTTEEMLEELGKRHGGVVLLALSDTTPRDEAVDVYYRGGRAQALGMLEIGKEFILNNKTEESL